jgi:hypothetical protein
LPSKFFQVAPNDARFLCAKCEGHVLLYRGEKLLFQCF